MRRSPKRKALKMLARYEEQIRKGWKDTIEDEEWMKSVKTTPRKWLELMRNQAKTELAKAESPDYEDGHFNRHWKELAAIDIKVADEFLSRLRENK